jgi:acetyltransferase
VIPCPVSARPRRRNIPHRAKNSGAAILHKTEAHAVCRAVRRGVRGAPARSESALRDVVLRVSALRVSALLEACPEIVELDLNPVIVTASRATAVDVRVRVRA